MILLTDELRERLLANGRDPGADHAPVVKFFNPRGEGVWLATELDADGDTMFGLADLGIIHRHGTLRRGEPIVLVMALAAHRQEALDAVSFVMDYLKTDAPFWKKERGPKGDTWVAARQADIEARRHWEEKK